MAANRVVNVTEFKAKCIAMIAEVESGQTSISVTRRGKTVAVLNPPAKQKYKSFRDSLAGKIREVGDIVNADESVDGWDIVNGRPWPK